MHTRIARHLITAAVATLLAIPAIPAGAAAATAPVISWANPADITYGTPLSATQLNATADVPGTFAYNPLAGTVLSAGTGQTLSVSFTPTDSSNYTTASATVHINVAQATPVISWANPADITYGTPLSATQLNATADVPGTFAYNPLAGTVLSAGTGQTLSVSFTPTDSSNYTTASATVHINVAQATPVISWANPADITYGTPLSATQLNATADVPGTFAYNPLAGTVLSAGTGQTLSVSFTPTDSSNYTTASATVHINVEPASTSTTLTRAIGNASSTYGTSLTFQASVDPSAANGAVQFKDNGVNLGSAVTLSGGIATYSTSALAVGSHTITAVYSGNSTYTESTSNGLSQTVIQASQATLILSGASSPAAYGDTQVLSTTGGSGTGATTFTSSTLGMCTVLGSTLSIIAPSGTCSVHATKAADTNYLQATSATVNITLQKASQTVSFTTTAPTTGTVGGPTYTPTATASSGLTPVTITIDAASGSICSVSAGIVSFTGAGACIIDANQAGNANYSAAPQNQQTFAVGKGSQTITFSPTSPTGAFVGANGLAVHATATSGLLVTYSSQTATICTVDSTSGALTFLAAGMCTITADQVGNANWSAAPQMSLAPITVTPPFVLPTLIITPDPQTRPFATANPAFTYVISGFINGQTLTTALVSGKPTCTTTATLFSPAGTYPITCTIGTLTSPFYSFAFVTGTLTITRGASSVSLSTTTTVFETSTPVTWTAAVEPGVSGAIPTGSLIFTIDGVARPAVPLDLSGHGSVTVTWPTTGVKSVSVTYSGDVSYAAPGIASASPKVVANTARVSGVGLSGTSIYPIVDGWLDTVTARGSRLEPLPVSITVKNASGAAVRTVMIQTGSGPYSWAWNGRNSSGSLVPAGVYTVIQTLTDPYGSRPRAVITSKVTLSLQNVSWSTVTVTARPGPRCFQFTSGDGVGAYACSGASGLALTGSAGHWPGVGYQFTLPAGVGYRSVRVELLGAFTGSKPAVGLHVWSLGTTWGQLYRPGWLRTSVSPTGTTWSGVTFTSPSGYISGRTVRVYVDGGGRLGGAFSFTVTGVRLIVSVGTLK